MLILAEHVKFRPMLFSLSGHTDENKKRQKFNKQNFSPIYGTLTVTVCMVVINVIMYIP